MKLIWSPEMALKAYIETVNTVSTKSFHFSGGVGAAEAVSAMAAGWGARLVVEAWSRGSTIAVSVGLATAVKHTGGRHVCIVPDEESRVDYVDRMARSGHRAGEVVVRGVVPVEEFEEIDFLVVDGNGEEEFSGAKNFGDRGAVLVCKNAGSRATEGSWWRRMIDRKSRRVVRSMFLPVGTGLDVAYVGATIRGGNGRGSRWVECIDSRSGEVFVIRK
ncbi:uncharacterized protein LOC127243230 [Andrographis paniculata]|uniref:uncharacterized protein LOC127243230 n=1 Tax=Andrographis paniculata TaxID=175694 RepID=UPI0021E81280|nr:uncharacterized protein LOC127243230 [Andrographis paniculata]